MKPIHKLAASGQTEMVRMIPDNSEVDPWAVKTTTPWNRKTRYINTTIPEYRRETPLYYAREGRHFETMTLLLGRGDVIPPDVEGVVGVEEDFDDIKAESFVLAPDPPSGIEMPPSNLAISNGKPVEPAGHVIQSYVKKVIADFETGISEEVISLHFHIEFPAQLADACCQKGYLGILQFLEENCGLDLILLKQNSYNPVGRHLLHSAATYGRADIVEFLLQRGYSVDSPFFYLGLSALQVALESHILNPGQKNEMVAFLLAEGADPNSRDEGGYTAMNRVYGDTSKGSRDLVQLLLEAGVDCGQKNRWGEDYMALIAQIGTRDQL